MNICSEGQGHSSRRRWLWLLLLSLSSTGLSSAQTTTTPPPEQPAAAKPEPGGVFKRDLRILYVMHPRTGKYMRVPNFTADVWEELAC